ncbi:MAG: DoxX family protein [Akkermansiaceae bacterium]|nr:DoxX family protein [Armatimonadota bacterium]
MTTDQTTHPEMHHGGGGGNQERAASIANDQQLAYALLRCALGTAFLMHFVPRLFGGIDTFAENMVKDFANTALPALLVRPFALALPFVEGILGVLLIAGFRTREAIVAVVAVMLLLIFGSSLQNGWQAVSIQLLYVLLAYILLAQRSASNTLSVDGLIARRNAKSSQQA